MSVYFADMYQTDFNINDIVVLHQTFWTKCMELNMKSARPSDALLYFLNCSAICSRPGKEDEFVPKGSLVHIARGSIYKWSINMEPGVAPVTFLFEFNLTDKSGELIPTGEGITVLDSGNIGIYEVMFEKLLHEFSRPTKFEAVIKMYAYSLLAEIIKQEKNLALESSIVDEKIYVGIRYLENNTSQTKSIAEVAQMCNMSLSSFEKQFKRYSGVTPMMFRTNKRLEYAEKLLTSSNKTIAEIVEILGFYDGAYFCRLFKKKYGVSPVSFRKTK